MTFNPEVSAGNVITLVSLVVLISGAWAKLATGLSSLGKDSERRFEANGERIDEVVTDIKAVTGLAPRLNAMEQRMNAMDIQIAALETQNRELTKLSTDMTWMKSTLQAVANKLGVLPVPPV